MERSKKERRFVPSLGAYVGSLSLSMGGGLLKRKAFLMAEKPKFENKYEYKYKNVAFAEKIVRDLGESEFVKVRSGMDAAALIQKEALQLKGMSKIIKEMESIMAVASPLYSKGKKFGVISTGVYDDLAMILHELGHHMDVKRWAKIKQYARILGGNVAIVGLGVAVGANRFFERKIEKNEKLSPQEMKMYDVTYFAMRNKALILALGASPILWQEAKASIFALRNARKYGLPLSSTIKKLGFSYANYFSLLVAPILSLYIYEYIQSKYVKPKHEMYRKYYETKKFD